ncbi:MAG: glycosyltransferase family 4 protein [Candidatus Omnitrophota bacterium]
MTSGISTQLFNTWKHLPPEKVVILAPKLEGAEETDLKLPMKVIRRRFSVSNTSLLARVTKSLLLPFFVYPIVRRYGISRIICGTPVSAGFCGLVMKKFFRIPYVVYVYGGEIEKYSKFKPSLSLIRCILLNAVAVVANSRYSASEFIDGFKIHEGKFLIVHPGVDTERFKPGPRPLFLLDRYGMKGKKVLVTVARLAERKGHDMVIRALKSIIGKFPEVVYLIVGGGSYREKLESLVKKLELTDNVIFTGVVPDNELPAHYQLSEIYVMPNRETKGALEAIEGFGISFIEAGACGKAVVGGRSGGVEDAVVDGVTGILVDPSSEWEVAESIMRLLRENDLRIKLGENGRKRAEDIFQWTDLAEKLEVLLKPE